MKFVELHLAGGKAVFANMKHAHHFEAVAQMTCIVFKSGPVYVQETPAQILERIAECQAACDLNKAAEEQKLRRLAAHQTRVISDFLKSVMNDVA